MRKNVRIVSDKRVFSHATLPSHKKYVQCTFDQHAMITGLLAYVSAVQSQFIKQNMRFSEWRLL
jgi:hypothetical protein